MNATTQRWCVYCGPLLMIVFSIGFWLVAGLIPVPDPDDPAEKIAQMYAEDETRIRIGLIISMFGAGFAFPFAVALFLQIRRIEGPNAPMAYVQLTTGIMNTLLFVIPMFCMAAATYRADSRDPEITEGLHDLGWLMFVGFAAPAIVQTVSIAIAVLRDHRPKPVYARWVGYFNVWCALLFVPGPLVICFHDGPFAWNGVFTFWIPLSVFGGWFFVMAYVTLKAIKDQELEEAGTQPTPKEPLHA